MYLTDSNIEELGITDDAAYLFWTVVQAVKDLVFFPARTYRYKNYHLLAKKWIFDPNYRVEWGDSDSPPSFTFGEALEMLGVQSENVELIREACKKAYLANTEEERKEVVRKVYSKLHFHDNEPDLYGWIGSHVGAGFTIRTEEVF